MTATDLVIQALVQSEWELSERVSDLTLQNTQLVSVIADLAFERAVFEMLAERWLGMAKGSQLAATERAEEERDALRDELKRYCIARVAE